jgi:hypothetical protein
MFIAYLQPHLHITASDHEAPCNLVDKNQVSKELAAFTSKDGIGLFSNTSAPVNHTTRRHISDHHNRNIYMAKIWNFTGLLDITLEVDFYILLRVGSS